MEFGRFTIDLGWLRKGSRSPLSSLCTSEGVLLPYC
jgi:hypothetical protein